MIRSFFITLICLAASLPVSADRRSDEQAILATFESWDAGWAQKDVDLALQDYSDDVDWTNAFGDRFLGKEQLREGLSFIFGLDFVMTGSSQANEYADVRFLSDTVALVRSKLIRKAQQTSDGALMADRRINHLRVLEKRNGKWLIVSHMISQEHDKR